MERTPAVAHLITVSKGIAAAVLQKPGGEMTLEDTRPIEQVRMVWLRVCGMNLGQCGVVVGGVRLRLSAVLCALLSWSRLFFWGRRGSNYCVNYLSSSSITVGSRLFGYIYILCVYIRKYLMRMMHTTAAAAAEYVTT